MYIYLQDETKSCYQDAKLRPLQVKQNGGTEFTVSQNDIKKAISMQQNITVVIYSGAYTYMFFSPYLHYCSCTVSI